VRVFTNEPDIKTGSYSFAKNQQSGPLTVRLKPQLAVLPAEGHELIPSDHLEPEVHYEQEGFEKP
jgi:hypothetical protein